MLTFLGLLIGGGLLFLFFVRVAVKTLVSSAKGLSSCKSRTSSLRCSPGDFFSLRTEDMASGLPIHVRARSCSDIRRKLGCPRWIMGKEGVSLSVCELTSRSSNSEEGRRLKCLAGGRLPEMQMLRLLIFVLRSSVYKSGNGWQVCSQANVERTVRIDFGNIRVLLGIMSVPPCTLPLHFPAGSLGCRGRNDTG